MISPEYAQMIRAHFEGVRVFNIEDTELPRDDSSSEFTTRTLLSLKSIVKFEISERNFKFHY